MAMIDTFVTVDEASAYPARLDPKDRRNGWVSPHFTLDTVRKLAADTQTDAEEYGHDCTDTVHVIDGGTDDDGNPHAIVLKISWEHLDDEGARQVTQIIEPDSDGLYGIGGREWTWRVIGDGPLFEALNAAYKARKRLLAHSARTAGAILRTFVPEITEIVVDVIDGTRIVTAFTGQIEADLSGDGPLDAETIGEASDVLDEAFSYGRDEHSLKAAGWSRVPGEAAQYRIRLGAPAPRK